jgi:hypothetical protein
MTDLDREVQKHTDPTDPYSDPDPQHWLELLTGFSGMSVQQVSRLTSESRRSPTWTFPALSCSASRLANPAFFKIFYIFPYIIIVTKNCFISYDLHHIFV